MTDLQKRKILVFQGYLSGRILVMQEQAKRSPAEATTCEMAIAELQHIYDNIVPELLSDRP